MNHRKTLATISIPIAGALLLHACGGEPMSPEEQAFIAHVEAAESMIASVGGGEPTRAQCSALTASVKDMEAAFKVILPNLKPFDVRSKDRRIGDIKTYVEGNC